MKQINFLLTDHHNSFISSFLQIPMGQYMEQYFTEPAAVRAIDKFRKELKELEEQIIAQNEGLELQYLYLCPSRIENSITI